jgi:hypothetical protein
VLVIRPNPLLPPASARSIARLLGRTRLDLCVIERRGTGRDAGGAPTTGPFEVVQGVECRVSQPGRAPLERVSGQQFGAEADYEIALPPDTQVNNNDRITVNGKTLEVVYVPSAISYGFELKVQAKASS